MDQIYEFNRHRPPILAIQLPDDAQTRLNLTPPTVDLQEELRGRRKELRELLNQEDEVMVEALYDLAARLMNCNRNLKKFTAESLRTVYNLDVVDLVSFYNLYADFLNRVENAKN